MSEEHVKGGWRKWRPHQGGRWRSGDERLKAEGQFDQVKGGAHQAWGDVKDAAKDLAARLTTVRARSGRGAERDALKRKDLP